MSKLNPKPKFLEVVVKVAASSTYIDTVRAHRGDSGLNHYEYGAHVASMRKTHECHILVELAKGAKSEATIGIGTRRRYY